MSKVINVPREKASCAPLKRNPRHLNGVAKQKWKSVLSVLAPEVATERQFDVVTRYCIAWAAYMEAVTALESEPAVILNTKTGAMQPSPWTKIRIECDKTLFSLGLKLGLIPNGKDIPATDKTPPVSKFGGLTR